MRWMNVVLSLFLCYITPKLRAFSPPPLTSYSTRSSYCLLHSRILLDDVDINHLQDLPINGILDSVKESIQTRPNLLLEASPGAGKTTIIPLLVSSHTED